LNNIEVSGRSVLMVTFSVSPDNLRSYSFSKLGSPVNPEYGIVYLLQS